MDLCEFSIVGYHSVTVLCVRMKVFEENVGVIILYVWLKAFQDNVHVSVIVLVCPTESASGQSLCNRSVCPTEGD